MKLYQRHYVVRNGKRYRTYSLVKLSDECQLVQGKVICPGYGAAKAASKLYLELLESGRKIDRIMWPLAVLALLLSMGLNIYLLAGGR